MRWRPLDHPDHCPPIAPPPQVGLRGTPVPAVRGPRGGIRDTRRPRRSDWYGDRPLPDWNGGHDWSGRYHVPVWARIAGAVLDRGFDVEDSVERAFALVAEAGSPYPNKLLAPTALEHYERTLMDMVVRRRRVNRRVIENPFALAVGHMKPFGIPPGEAAALAVLRDTGNSLPPFLRFWVVARFFIEKPQYREVWSSCRRPALFEYDSSVRAYEAA